MAEDNVSGELRLLARAVVRGPDGMAVIRRRGVLLKRRLPRSLRPFDASGLAKVSGADAGVVGARTTAGGIKGYEPLGAGSTPPSRPPSDVSYIRKGPQPYRQEGPVDGVGQTGRAFRGRERGSDMDRPIRISATPPCGAGSDPGETYYCDLHRVDDWMSSHFLLQVAPEDRTDILRDGVAGYVVTDGSVDWEIGLVVCVKTPGYETAYHGVDLKGRVSVEPSVNEATWDLADAGRDLVDVLRIARHKIA